MRLPIIGYRLWLVDSGELTISSLTEELVWPVGGFAQSDRLPDEQTKFSEPGLHWLSRFDVGDKTYDCRPSFDLWFGMERTYRKHFQMKRSLHWVAGAVVVWGRTVLHELGGRSNFARLVALHYAVGRKDELLAKANPGYDGTQPPPQLQTLATKYGVPLCLSHAHLRAVALEHGREVYAEDLVA